MKWKNRACSFIPLFFILEMIRFVAMRPQFDTVFRDISKEIEENLDNQTLSLIKTLSDEALYNEENDTESRILNKKGGQAPHTKLHYAEKSDIIFPDNPIIANLPKLSGTPKCAESSTYCEDFESYPYLRVKEILQTKHVHKEFFGKDELPEDYKYNISNRLGETDEFLCTGVQKTIFPRVGKNKNNKWKFIINQEESDNYIQGVRVEVCQREGSPCELIGDLPNGYRTSCKQKYILRRLISLSDSGEPVPDSFQLPSACCCAYKKDINFFSRVASRVTPMDKYYET